MSSFFTRSVLVCAIMLAVAAFTSGCSTTASRIRGNQEVFASFPADVQQSIRDGEIDIGFTNKMVEIALGPPNRIYERRESDASYWVWSYTGVYRYYEWPRFWRRSYAARGPGGIRYYDTFYEPWYWDRYMDHEYELMRVVFDSDGRVVAIEQLVQGNR